MAKKNFKIGDVVYWNDPAIDDYPIEERADLLDREFTITFVSGYDNDSIIYISDGYTDAEVYASELELV